MEAVTALRDAESADRADRVEEAGVALRMIAHLITKSHARQGWAEVGCRGRPFTDPPRSRSARAAVKKCLHCTATLDQCPVRAAAPGAKPESRGEATHPQCSPTAQAAPLLASETVIREVIEKLARSLSAMEADLAKNGYFSASAGRTAAKGAGGSGDADARGDGSVSDDDAAACAGVTSRADVAAAAAETLAAAAEALGEEEAHEAAEAEAAAAVEAERDALEAAAKLGLPIVAALFELRRIPKSAAAAEAALPTVNTGDAGAATPLVSATPGSAAGTPAPAPAAAPAPAPVLESSEKAYVLDFALKHPALVSALVSAFESGLEGTLLEALLDDPSVLSTDARIHLFRCEAADWHAEVELEVTVHDVRRTDILADRCAAQEEMRKRAPHITS